MIVIYMRKRGIQIGWRSRNVCVANNRAELVCVFGVRKNLKNSQRLQNFRVGVRVRSTRACGVVYATVFMVMPVPSWRTCAASENKLQVFLVTTATSPW